MVFAKLLSRGAKSGYTLVEVLVVVIIMGVLSTMGVAGLQRAIANARIKDAAVNTAAFIERVANESSRLSAVLCLKIDPGNPQTIIVVKDVTTKNCAAPNGGVIDEFSIEAPAKYVSKTTQGCPTSMVDWFGGNNHVFKPRIGLSAAPPEGGVCIQYGSQDIYGAVRKDKKVNRVIPMWKVGSDFTQNGNWSNWTEL